MERNSVFIGARYYIDGAELLIKPELRWYALVPILVNILLFIGLTTAFVAYYNDGVLWLENELPSWLNWLAWLLGIVFAIVMLVAYGFFFTTLTNIIASPFYGFLAEKTERVLTGQPLEGESLLEMIPRVVMREIRKQIYFILWGLLVFILALLLSFTGVGSPIATMLTIAWSAWCVAVQYTDYAADNNKLSFGELRSRLGEQRWTSLGFGGTAMLFTMIPIINIFAAPVAVCGATKYWVNNLR